MAMVIRVRFKRAAKLYDFDPNGLELHNGMSVVTETARGVELGEVHERRDAMCRTSAWFCRSSRFFASPPSRIWPCRSETSRRKRGV